MILELLVFFVTLLIIFSYVEKRPKNFPPGPMGLPLLGHLPLLGTEPYKTLVNWQRSYGPIIGVWFGSYRTVVINDVKLMKEAMNSSAFAGRPELDLFVKRSLGVRKGIIVTEGHHWTEQRRFALRNLRDFGFGTKSMAEKIQDEISELTDRLKHSAGKPIHIKNLFNNAVINALWSILLGERMSYDDPEVQNVFNKLTSLIDETSFVASLSMFMPWLNRVAPKLSGFEKMMADLGGLLKFLKNHLANHRANYVPDQPKDFVEVYFDESNKTKDPKSSFHKDREEILFVLFDLFSAGTETTSTTLSWIILYMIHNPQVQKKLQDEIDRVVGQRLPTMADKASMPYTEAVINEALRMSSIAPFGVFHSTTEDVDFHGYFIPKDTMIIANLYNAHHNKDLWGDPENFRPERFIDSDGKFKKSENLLPFSSGKRVCLGESLARDQLFLFTTNILQTFDVSSAGSVLPTLEPHMGMTLGPQAFDFVLSVR